MFFGYVDSYDDRLNRTMVLGITRTDMNMTGNITATENITTNGDISVNKPLLPSLRSIYLSPIKTDISNLFATKMSFAAYFAEDFSGNTLPNYFANGRDATITGTITQTTLMGQPHRYHF